MAVTIENSFSEICEFYTALHDMIDLSGPSADAQLTMNAAYQRGVLQLLGKMGEELTQIRQMMEERAGQQEMADWAAEE